MHVHSCSVQATSCYRRKSICSRSDLFSLLQNEEFESRATFDEIMREVDNLPLDVEEKCKTKSWTIAFLHRDALCAVVCSALIIAVVSLSVCLSVTLMCREDRV